MPVCSSSTYKIYRKCLQDHETGRCQQANVNESFFGALSILVQDRPAPFQLMLEQRTDTREEDCGLQYPMFDVLFLVGCVEQIKRRWPVEDIEQGVYTLVIDVEQKVVHLRGHIYRANII